MSESSKFGRRRFLKYVGAGAIGVGGAAAVAYLTKDYWREVRDPEEVTTKRTMTSLSLPSETTKINHAPIADFRYKPQHINPTDQQTIQFTNGSYDPDDNPLQYNWCIDGKLASTQKDYSSKLPTGGHTVQLNVSDGIAQSSDIRDMTVEPDQIYPTNNLNIRYKGIRYAAGTLGPIYTNVPTPSRDEMDEQLDTIHDELGCNAVTIYAGPKYEDNLIEAGRLAVQKGFERIYVNPDNMDLTVDETIARLRRFIPKMKSLRETSDSAVFMVGHEFDTETRGVLPGDNWPQRVDWARRHTYSWFDLVKANLPDMFKAIVTLCKQDYGYEIAYDSSLNEVDLVPWSDPSFGSVDVGAYLVDAIGFNEGWIMDLFSRLKRFRKPVYSAEWGTMTFKGAYANPWLLPSPGEDYPYDEDEQASYVRRYCEFLNRATISGCFYTQYNEDYDKGYGLYNGMRRKKGFYMYKSYQRSG